MISPLRNLYKCKQVACSVCCCLLICLFAVFKLHFVVACLILNPFFYIDVFVAGLLFFILMLLPYFCIFVDHVNKPIIFCFFGAFVYHFQSTISIFVTIYMTAVLLRLTCSACLLLELIIFMHSWNDHWGNPIDLEPQQSKRLKITHMYTIFIFISILCLMP